MTAPRIYVASLSDYNAGILHGVWIDCAGKDYDDLMEEVRAMLKDSPTAKDEGQPAEEWAIHDHEGFGNEIEEYTGIDTVAELVAIYDELGSEDDWEIWLEYASDLGTRPSVDEFREAYAGTFKDLGEWAYEFHQDCGDKVPDWLENYVDWDAIGRDAELNGDVMTVDCGGSVAVFWNR